MSELRCLYSFYGRHTSENIMWIASCLFILHIVTVVGYKDNSIGTSQTQMLGQHHHMTKTKQGSDAAVEYLYCYQYFMKLYAGNSLTYRGVCHARDKLKVCKHTVLNDHPRIEERVAIGYQLIYEMTAEYWCTYNLTHPIPGLFPSMDIMYAKFIHCPYRSYIMLSHEDYSAKFSLGLKRSMFATNILSYTGQDGLGRYQDNHKYEDPRDPVYSALSAWACENYKWDEFYQTKIMDKYCAIIADIDKDYTNIITPLTRFARGLYNWTTSLCSEYKDTLEQAMRISQLEKWLDNQKNSALPPCHDHNVYIDGVTCLILFHTKLPPYTDIHNFMPAFVKNVGELNSCWRRTQSGCPGQSGAARNISIIVSIYNIACDISEENSADVWDVIYTWADVYKKTEKAQEKLQVVYQILTERVPVGWHFRLEFARSLTDALRLKTPVSSNITALFNKLSSILNNLVVVTSDDYEGVNIFEAFHSMNKFPLGLLIMCLQSMYELFVEVGQFVEYKASCPEWWFLPCE